MLLSIIMARVHVLGNSIAYGFGLEDRSWPSLIKGDTNRRRYNGDQPRITIVQLGSPGNLLYHILESGLLEASVNCNRRGKQIGLFCVGACEASILRSMGDVEPRRSKVDFKHDLERLNNTVSTLNASQSSEAALSVVLMGTTPVDPVKSLRSHEGDDFNGQRIREYDSVMKDHAQNIGIRYVDLQAGFHLDAMLANDGIHLSEAGEEFVYTKTMPAILGELGLKEAPQD